MAASIRKSEARSEKGSVYELYSEHRIEHGRKNSRASDAATPFMAAAAGDQPAAGAELAGCGERARTRVELELEWQP